MSSMNKSAGFKWIDGGKAGVTLNASKGSAVVGGNFLSLISIRCRFSSCQAAGRNSQ